MGVPHRQLTGLSLVLHPQQLARHAGLSHLGIEVEQIGCDEAGQRRTFDREDALFQRIMGHLIGKGPWQGRGFKAGEDLKNRRCTDFHRQSDTTVGQLLVELELKDLKTGFHRTPGFSLFGHRCLRWDKNQQRRPCKKELIPGVIGRMPNLDRL